VSGQCQMSYSDLAVLMQQQWAWCCSEWFTFDCPLHLHRSLVDCEGGASWDPSIYKNQQQWSSFTKFPDDGGNDSRKSVELRLHIEAADCLINSLSPSVTIDTSDVHGCWVETCPEQKCVKVPWEFVINRHFCRILGFHMSFSFISVL
jgi:hypothetical protein